MNGAQTIRLQKSVQGICASYKYSSKDHAFLQTIIAGICLLVQLCFWSVKCIVILGSALI